MTSSTTFLSAFWRYVWYRSGPAIASGASTLAVGLALLAIYPDMPLAARVLIGFLVLMVLLALIDVLCLADRVETGQSTYPRQLFLLPASATKLALAPLCGSAVLMGGLGLELGYGVCARLTGYAQAWWAAPFLVGSMCLFSAISWRSYPHSTIRLLVSLVGVCALLAGPVLLVTDLASPWQVGLAYAATIPFSLASAIHSVGLARRGEAVRPWKLADRVKPRPAFRSPMEAQVWLEVKRSGIFATVMVSVLATVMGSFGAFAIWFSQETMTVDGTAICKPAVLVPIAIVGMSLLILSLAGCCASPLDNVTTSSELQPFLALRPMSTAQLVGAKMRMAAIVALRCSAISLALAVCLLLIPAPANPAGRPTLFVLAQTLTWQQAALGFVVYLAALLGAWKGMVSSIWCSIGMLPLAAHLAWAAPLPIQGSSESEDEGPVRCDSPTAEGQPSPGSPSPFSLKEERSGTSILGFSLSRRTPLPQRSARGGGQGGGEIEPAKVHPSTAFWRRLRNVNTDDEQSGIRSRFSPKRERRGISILGFSLSRRTPLPQRSARGGGQGGGEIEPEKVHPSTAFWRRLRSVNTDDEQSGIRSRFSPKRERSGISILGFSLSPRTPLPQRSARGGGQGGGEFEPEKVHSWTAFWRRQRIVNGERQMRSVRFLRLLVPFEKLFFTAVLPALLPLAAICIPMYLFSNPELLPKALAAVPYVAGAFVLLKLTAAAFATRRLRQLSLVPDRTIIIWTVAWLLIAATLVAALSPLRSLLGLTLPTLAFAQLLSLPFTRLALAPPLTTANRHR